MSALAKARMNIIVGDNTDNGEEVKDLKPAVV